MRVGGSMRVGERSGRGGCACLARVTTKEETHGRAPGDGRRPGVGSQGDVPRSQGDVRPGQAVTTTGERARVRGRASAYVRACACVKDPSKNELSFTF